MEFKPVIQSGKVSVLPGKVKKPERTPVARQQQLVACWQSSGVSQAEFCRQHQLNRKTFVRWRLKWISDKAVPDSLKPLTQASPSLPIVREWLVEIQLPSQIHIRVSGCRELSFLAALIREVG